MSQFLWQLQVISLRIAVIDGPIIEDVTKAAEELQLQLGGSTMCMDSYSALGMLVAACAWTSC